MPHSSGGGSHGGGHSGGSGISHSSGRGSHGGGHSHGGPSRSHGGGHSHGSTAGYGTRTSKEPFPGSTLYIYANSRGQETRYYHNGLRPKPDAKATIAKIAVILVMALAICAGFCSLAKFTPEKLDLASYDAAIVVEDHLGVADDPQLMAALENFQQVTGLTPSVEFAADEDWEGRYSNLETYAYSEYLRFFDDEKHWLFVISYPADYQTGEFVDWKWEGMIGDEASPVADDKTEEDFTAILHKYLLRSAPQDADTQVAAAFDEYAKTVMEPHVYPFGYVLGAIIAAVGIVWALLLWLKYRKAMCLYLAKPQYNDRTGKNLPAQSDNHAAKDDEPEIQHYNCEYCGALYTYGTDTECPKCGAPVPDKD